MTDYSKSPRDSTRVPLAHRIQLKFARFSGFIDEYVSNISPGGIFIRTDSPEAPGQLLEFEFRLGDGFELIRGRGEVVWARHPADTAPAAESAIGAKSTQRPAGMGVRFLELSPGSRDLIYKIVDDYVAHGGKPFELMPPPSSAAAEPPPASPPAADMAPQKPETRQAGAVKAPPALPWTLDLPAIRPIPGMPAITPHSPLDLLGAGGGAQKEKAAAAGAVAMPAPTLAAPSAMPATATTAAPATTATTATTARTGGPGGPGGQTMDPLEQLLATLPPLEDLAPQQSRAPADPAPPVPAAPAEIAAPATQPATEPSGSPLPPPAPAPAFSAFDLRAPRRRSRVALLVASAAVLLLALAAYLLRDTLLGWVEQRETPAAPTAPAARRGFGTSGASGASGASGTPGTPGRPAATSSPARPASSSSQSASSGGVLPPSTPEAQLAATDLARTPAGGAEAPSNPPPLVSARVAPNQAATGSGAVTALDRISWEVTPGGTDVILWGNGEFTPQSYTRTRVGGVGGLPIREVIRLVGIARPFQRPNLAVHTAEVAQIRTGYHPQQELHVVLDLAGRDVKLSGIEAGPRQLRIHLAAR